MRHTTKFTRMVWGQIAQHERFAVPMWPSLALVLVFCVTMVMDARARDYDPLATTLKTAPPHVDFTVHDLKRNRDIPLRVYLPANTSPAPVVLFSHGLGGSRTGSAFLGEHWAARSYVAVSLQHPGSDYSVWKSESREDHMGGSSTLHP